ncbi:MAG: hypothetical protein AAGC85_02145 [Bacteroidota bacterium]
MTQSELIETIKNLPVQVLLPLQEAIEQRLSSLSKEEEEVLRDDSQYPYVPTPEQSAELNRILEAHRKGELTFISREEFKNRMKAKRSL